MGIWIIDCRNMKSPRPLATIRSKLPAQRVLSAATLLEQQRTNFSKN
jgi:hypothetical protein